MNKYCIYCSNPDIKKRLIIENGLAWAFPTNIPITEGHTLISPKRCVETFDKLTTEEKLAIFNLIEGITSSLKKSFGAQGFNYAWNEGILSGQSIPHFHLHVIPRKDGDTGLLGYDPRSMIYRTCDRKATPESELLKIRDIIKENLN